MNRIAEKCNKSSLKEREENNNSKMRKNRLQNERITNKATAAPMNNVRRNYNITGRNVKRGECYTHHIVACLPVNIYAN